MPKLSEGRVSSEDLSNNLSDELEELDQEVASSSNCLIPLLVNCVHSRIADGTCPKLLIESISWALIDAKTSDVLCRRSEPIQFSSEQNYQASFSEAIGKLNDDLRERNGIFVTCGPTAMRQYFHPAARQNSVDLTGESHFFSYVDLNKEFARRYGNVTTMPATALVSHHEPISVHFPEQLAGYQQQGALLQQQQYCYCYSNSQYYYQLALDQQQQALATEPAEPRSLSSDNFYSSSSTPLSGHKQTISSPEQQLNCQQPVAGGSDSVQSRQLEDMLNFLSIESQLPPELQRQPAKCAKCSAKCSATELLPAPTRQEAGADQEQEVSRAADGADANEKAGAEKDADHGNLGDQDPERVVAATGESQPEIHGDEHCLECSKAKNERQLEVMCLLVRQMLEEGHQFNRIELIKRGVEIGFCESNRVRDHENRIVRARGLPWQATEQDIASFFAGLNIERGGVALCLSRQGRRNGEALIQFETREQRNLALGRHKHFMGQRYIEIYRASGEDFLSVAAGYNHKAQAFLSRGAQVIIRMRGLPFSCTGKQVLDFFQSPASNSNNKCDVLGGEDGILFVKNRDDKPTGDAFVLFKTEEMAQRALLKHKQNVGSRYVELFRSTISEVQQVLSIQTPPSTFNNQSTTAGPLLASGTKGSSQAVSNKQTAIRQAPTIVAATQNGEQIASSKQVAKAMPITYAQVAKSQDLAEPISSPEKADNKSKTDEQQDEQAQATAGTTSIQINGADLNSSGLATSGSASTSSSSSRQDDSAAQSPISTLSAASSLTNSSSYKSSSRYTNGSASNGSTGHNQKQANYQPSARHSSYNYNYNQQPQQQQQQFTDYSYQNKLANQGHFFSGHQHSGYAGYHQHHQAYQHHHYPRPAYQTVPSNQDHHQQHQHQYAIGQQHQLAAAYAAAVSAANQSQTAPLANYQHHQPYHYPTMMHHHQHAAMHPYHHQQQQQPQSGRKDCIKLRGLPFEAQVEDVLKFLGQQHSKNILYQGIHMVYSAHGQPSGEAIIQMNSSQAAQEASQEFHRKVMSVGKKQRYIEVIPCSIDDMLTNGAGAALAPAMPAHYPMTYPPAYQPVAGAAASTPAQPAPSSVVNPVAASGTPASFVAGQAAPAIPPPPPYVFQFVVQ